MITQSELKQYLTYCHTSGIFTRNSNGKILGKEGKRKVIRIGSKLYKGARLAWLYMEGYFPEHVVDHKDLDFSNDKWDNLRHATHSCNHQNTTVSSKNTTGYKGVSKYGSRFRASVRLNQKLVSLGIHDTPELAYAARIRWEKENDNIWICPEKK